MRQHLVVTAFVERLPAYYHLLCGLCQLRWYWASMLVLITLKYWPSPKIAFRLPSEAGVHAQLAHAVINRIDS